MDGDMYKPNGELQGDTKPMPDRGTSTGMNGDSYGADLSQDSTNRQGSIGRATQSDAAFDNDADADGEQDGDE